MKKTLFILTLTSLILLGCNKDEFSYAMEDLYGAWDWTETYVDKQWVESNEAYTIAFNSNGTFVGDGNFLDGKGTYSAKGKTIILYINNQEAAKFEIKSFDGKKGKAEVIVKPDNVRVRLERW